MEIMEVIKRRRSIRSFKEDAVPEALIEKVVEAGSFAASGMNMQSPIIIAVTKKEICDKIRKENAKIMGKPENFDPFYKAPVIIIVLAKKECPTHVFDGSMALGNMMLEAYELGLGSCWIHRAKEEFEMTEWKNFIRTLGIEDDVEGIGHLALGYVDGEYPEIIPRKENRVFYVK